MANVILKKKWALPERGSPPSVFELASEPDDEGDEFAIQREYLFQCPPFPGARDPCIVDATHVCAPGSSGSAALVSGPAAEVCPRDGDAKE